MLRPAISKPLSRVFQILLRTFLLICTLRTYFFKMGHSRPLFIIFVFSIQLTVYVQYKFFLMSEYNPWTSGIRSNRSTNWATTTALITDILANLSLCQSHFVMFTLILKNISENSKVIVFSFFLLFGRIEASAGNFKWTKTLFMYFLYLQTLIHFYKN